MNYSNPLKYCGKFSAPGIAWLRCRPWRASARLRFPPCPAIPILASFSRIISVDCYRRDQLRVAKPGWLYGKSPPGIGVRWKESNGPRKKWGQNAVF